MYNVALHSMKIMKTPNTHDQCHDTERQKREKMGALAMELTLRFLVCKWPKTCSNMFKVVQKGGIVF